jgi:uncharacterized protein YidB (DUF937 family)
LFSVGSQPLHLATGLIATKAGHLRRTDMGLLDILNGMQHGPHGQRQPRSSSGMSPITMALLGVLAYKAFKSSGGLGNILGGGQHANPGTRDRPASPVPGNTADAGKPAGGGLGDLLGGLFGGGPGIAKPGGSVGGLGGLLGGADAGGVLSGGLGNLIKDLQNSGHDRAVQSWIGSGPNEAITPNNLEAALGSDTIDAISKQSGLGRDELLAALSKHLPGFVDHLTPEGRLPTEAEASRMV